jgi:hypothetical protein
VVVVGSAALLPCATTAVLAEASWGEDGPVAAMIGVFVLPLREDERDGRIVSLVWTIPLKSSRRKLAHIIAFWHYVIVLSESRRELWSVWKRSCTIRLWAL